MTIEGPRADISWIDEIQDWSKFDKQWIRDAEYRGVKDPYTQKLYDEIDARLLYHFQTQDNLKALAQKYLPEPDWTPAPPAELRVRVMTREERALHDAMYFGYYHGAAQQWRKNP